MTASKKRHIALVCIAVMLMLQAVAVYGQQSQPFTQYLFNRFLLNPAACGADGYTSIGTTIKDQWTGFPQSPTNQTLTAQIRVPREGLLGGGSQNRAMSGFSPENIGLGVALFNDMRGPIRTTGGSLTYSYHIEDPFGQLSFGLTTSFFQLYINRDKLTTELGYDSYLDATKLSSFIPDASAGVHYTTPDFYTGFSVSNLFQSFLTFGGRSSSDYRLERQYIFLGGIVFDIARAWSMVPGVQFKFTERMAGQFDFNLITYYYDEFWGGFSFRSGGEGFAGGASMILGMRYQNYHFGYAFDHPFSNIRKYAFGSHELMISATFGREGRFYRYARKYEFQDSEQQYRRTWIRRRNRG